MKTLKSLILCLIVIMGVSSSAIAAPLSLDPIAFYYVKETGTSTQSCLSWDSACDLQTALSLANSVSEIWVAAGTYKPSTGSIRTISFNLKSGVSIYGGFPAGGGDWASRDSGTHITTLSGDIGIEGNTSDNSYHVVAGNYVDAAAVLDGFTISDGNADSGGTEEWGGGMYCNGCSLTLKNITFRNNLAKAGGGLFVDGGNPTLNIVEFINNTATINGGGMHTFYSANPTLIDVTFQGNTATESGGGMMNYDNNDPTLTNVRFENNTAGVNGGGMYNQDGSDPTLKEVTFSGNSAIYLGGGLYNNNSSPTLTNVTFTGNSAYYGGGLSNDFSNPTLTNVTFSGNSATYGGGMDAYYSSPSLTNVTFSANSANYGGGMDTYYSNSTLTNVTFSTNSASSGGGMHNRYNSSTLTNSILWGNLPDQLYNYSGTPLVTYSVIQDWISGGTGNTNADPLLGPLVDNGGFTQTHALKFGSSAIDAGNQEVCTDTDQRGFPRPLDGNNDGTAICDMGAYEYKFESHIYLPMIVK